MALDLPAAPTDQDPSSLYMGPSLLAQQPVTPVKSRDRLKKEWGIAYGKLESTLGALRNWRYSWWTYWSVLAAFFNPRRYLWLVTANRMWRGNSINDQIIDSTGLQALRVCGAGMWTGLTSPSRPWFEIETAIPQEELDSDAKAWIEDSQQKAYAVLHGSNFYTVMAQAFEDVALFGTAPPVMYEDFEDVVRFYLPAAGEYYLAIGPRLTVDTFNREFTYTVKQIVGRWQVEQVPQEVQRLWQNGGAALETEFVVCHSIEPNYPFDDGNGGEFRLVPEEFTWREVYWVKGMTGEQPLEANGFRSSPFFTFRWSTVANDAYGRSPAMDALGDNKQVQLETLRKAEFIEKGVRPPMGADPSLKNEPASIVPGNVTYVTASGQNRGFWPLFEPHPQWLQALTQDIDKVNARIERCLFVDLFMAITRMEGVQPRNELELTQRNQERLQELGPVVHLAETELGKMLKRLFDIMMQRRILAPIPPSLTGIPFRINFVSIMRLAQRSSESVSMKDVLQVGGVMSAAARNAGLPDPLRNLNLDKAYRRYGSLNDFDEDLWFTIGEVKKSDDARAKQEQMAQAVPDAAAAVSAAKVMSETQIQAGAGGGGGSLLDSVIGSGAGA